jgi:hypothetical protein
MSTPGKWMGLLMEVARCIAHDAAVFDGALAAHSGMNPIDKNGSAPWVGVGTLLEPCIPGSLHPGGYALAGVLRCW